MTDETRQIKTRRSKEKPASRTATIVRFIVLAFVAALCLAAVSGAGLLNRIPKTAAEKFGPPGPALSFYQKIAYSVRLLAMEETLKTPVDPQGIQRAFTIDMGESVDSIAYRLESQGLIRSAEAFRTYLVYAGTDTRVQAGKYQISPAMNALEIAAKLQDPVPEDVEFRILPGWRAEEIAASLPTSGIQVDPERFLELVNNPTADLLPDGAEDANSLEGFLMPGLYQVRREISAEDLLAMFVNRFEESLTGDVRQGFLDQGLNLVEAVTLASVVQREAVVEDEQPLIASVFYNRLANGMRLESDPTVQYALANEQDGNPWWKSPLASADLQVDSRYNTYIYPGLPPGPIANPDESALRAVAFPEQSGFFFFRAQCDGSGRHFFSVTYEEHLGNACP